MPPETPYGQNQSSTPPPDYDFIMNPPTPSRPSRLPLGSGNSAPQRALLVFGGLVILLIVGIILKSAFSSKADMTGFLAVAQEQQEIIHICTAANEENSLSTTHRNFALTTQLSTTTAQQNIIAYIKENGQKVNQKQLGLLTSSSTDQKLSDAATVDNYNPVFKDIMSAELAKYQQLLKQAAATAGPNGQQITSQQLKDLQLLQEQLDNSSNDT